MRRLQNVALLLVAAALPAMAQKNTPASSPLKTGISLFDAEKLEQAKAVLAPLGRAGDAEAMYYLGRIAIEQSDGDSAVIWLEAATKMNDANSAYHKWLGSAYGTKALAASVFSQLGFAKSMLRESTRAVELDPNNLDARADLIQFYLQAPAVVGGGVDKAREQAAAIMERNSYQGRLQNAAIAENQKDTVAAEGIYKELIAQFPDSSAPTTSLAVALTNRKRYDDALVPLEARLKKAPNDGAVLYQIGRVGALSGTHLDRAQWALNRYLKLPHMRGTPTIAAAHWRLGMVVEAKGDKKTARSEYETALRLDPKLTGAQTSLNKLK